MKLTTMDRKLWWDICDIEEIQLIFVVSFQHAKRVAVAPLVPPVPMASFMYV